VLLAGCDSPNVLVNVNNPSGLGVDISACSASSTATDCHNGTGDISIMNTKASVGVFGVPAGPAHIVFQHTNSDSGNPPAIPGQCLQYDIDTGPGAITIQLDVVKPLTVTCQQAGQCSNPCCCSGTVFCGEQRRIQGLEGIPPDCRAF
jgi:hypothetical protein